MDNKLLIALWGPLVLVYALIVAVPAGAADPAMMVGRNGYTVEALFTVGNSVNGYTPVGILDGIGAWELDADTIRLLVAHELSSEAGYAYSLANGTSLTGARISYFDLSKTTHTVKRAGLAYDKVYDRHGEQVTHPSQINERLPGQRGYGSYGFDRFCSAAGYSAGEYGFVDSIFFSHEEALEALGHPHGGSVWAMEVAKGAVWALPELGRGAWENVAAMSTPDGHKPNGHIALLIGDDHPPAPLYLWIGRKIPGSDFLMRNGLTEGVLHVWVPREEAADPRDFNGQGSTLAGDFVPVQVRDTAKQGAAGYDAEGYRNAATLREAAFAKGAFAFSRPEDVHTDPAKGTRAVLASTGRGSLFDGADDWGTVYQLEVDFMLEHGRGEIRAQGTLTILYDGDRASGPDFGIRNPDNLTWASDGFIYIQEDRATQVNTFGGNSGREASIWRLNPRPPYGIQRAAEMNRSVVLPAGVTDSVPEDKGYWESSGILDVTPLFPTRSGERLLIGTVQAHSIRDGVIAAENLGEGGQLILIRKE
jgi:serralysin